MEIVKPQQTNQEIEALLFRALEYQYQVHIQLNELQQGETIASVTGYVKQLERIRVLIQVDHNRIHEWNLSQIRNVQLCPTNKIKWS